MPAGRERVTALTKVLLHGWCWIATRPKCGGQNFCSLEDRMYGKISEKYTPQGCRVITIKSVTRRTVPGCGTLVLTPVEEIILSGPENDETRVDKPNNV